VISLYFDIKANKSYISASLKQEFIMSVTAPPSQEQPSQSANIKKRILMSIFNRQNAGRAFAAGLLVDLFGYAGQHGANILKATETTQPAAAYYQTFGAVMNFGWRSFKELGRGIHEIVMRHNP
jgi:hypothetical protein